MESTMRTAAQARHEGAIAGWKLRRARQQMKDYETELPTPHDQQERDFDALAVHHALDMERIGRFENLAQTILAMAEKEQKELEAHLMRGDFPELRELQAWFERQDWLDLVALAKQVLGQ